MRTEHAARSLVKCLAACSKTSVYKHLKARRRAAMIASLPLGGLGSENHRRRTHDRTERNAG
jgi:hypothetical protein